MYKKVKKDKKSEHGHEQQPPQPTPSLRPHRFAAGKKSVGPQSTK